MIKINIPTTIKILNTGDNIKNEFYALNTPGKNTQNSVYKDFKIRDFIIFYNLFMNLDMLQIPNYIKISLPFYIIETEKLLEAHRQENFPEFPSRLACFFIFGNIEDAKRYRDVYHKGKDNKIFKIQISTNTYKVTKHNMEYVSVLRTTYNSDIFTPIIQNENLLHKYWKGEAQDFDYSKYNNNNGVIKPLFEYLIEGEYIVTPLED